MDALKAAIAQVNVGSSRGTGFLVSDDGLVLTALHVIADPRARRSDGTPVYYGGPITLRFGDPKNHATWVPEKPATVERYSFEDDWVLLRVQPPPQVAPLPLARLAPPQKGRAFETFGFPDQEAEVGGGYTGKLLDWGWKSELTAEQILVGAPMGGISGAPCVVDGCVVAMIVQALLDDQRRAVKNSLYAIDIERAARGAGLPWSDAAELPFEATVRDVLPSGPGALVNAARALRVPLEQATPSRVARRILCCRVAPDAQHALGHCTLPPAAASRVIDCVAAMQLRQPAVDALRAAAEGRSPALLRSCDDRIVYLYERRARYDTMGPDQWVNLTVVVPPRAGLEESTTGDLEGAAADLKGAIAKAAEAKWSRSSVILRRRLSASRHPGAEFCVLLRGELRFDVLARVGELLPNAHLLVVTDGEVVLRDEDRARVTLIEPALSPQEEDDLLADVECAYTALGLTSENA